MDLSANKLPRIEVVDALRGFAVMAILLVHNIEHFIFPEYPVHQPMWLSVINQGIGDVVFSLFAGKAYAIFALLFGFTFYVQSANQRRVGKDFGYRFLWRLVLLAVFATINAAFFPAGDVLMLFVVVGPVLFLTRDFSDKWLLAAAVFCLLQPLEWGRLIMAAADGAHQLPDLRVGQLYAEVGEVAASGNFKDFIVENVTVGQLASLLWAVDAGRAVQTAGLFLLGFYIGRRQLFIATEGSLRLWTKVLVIAAVAFGPLYVLKDAIMESASEMVRATAGTALDMWQKLAFALVLVAGFTLMYQGKCFAKAVDGLRYYGKMSLTNYLSQSVIGAFVYFPIGLHLAPYCGNALSLLVGVAVFMAQLCFSKWWLKHHRQGPLEHIWHKWTWFRR